MATISTNSVVIARLAQGMYGLQVGAPTMAEAIDAANWLAVNNPAEGGLAQLMNVLYARDFGSQTNADVAATLVTNLGITGAAAVAEANAYVVGRLDTAAAGQKGATIVDIVNLFSGLTGNAVYGAAATAFNAQTAKAVAYADGGSSADAPISSLAPIFVLSPFTALGADVMRLTGNQDVRIDFTNPANQIRGLDLDGDGLIETDGLENVSSNFPAADRGANRAPATAGAGPARRRAPGPAG